MRDVAVGHDLAAVERIREISQARAEDDADPGTDPHRQLRHHPMRTATSRSVTTTNIRMNQMASIATNGAKSMPAYCNGNNRRSGLHTRSETRSRNTTIGLFGSGRTHDSNAFTK